MEGMDLAYTYTITHITRRQLVRVGVCPVLEAEVCYPMLETAGDATFPAAERFNRAYLDMADAFLAWALRDPASAATEAFAALGGSAAYRFDRRMIACRMTASIHRMASIRRTASIDAAESGEAGGYLRVERLVRLSSRRGETAARERNDVDLWSWPSLRLCSPREVRRASRNRHFSQMPCNAEESMLQ